MRAKFESDFEFEQEFGINWAARSGDAYFMILYDGQDWLDCPLCTVAREALS